MIATIEDILSERIKKHCLPLLREQHYKHAAMEAMLQVELALKEKGVYVGESYGRGLIRKLLKPLGREKSVKLLVPLSEDLQDDAAALFDGAFAYYRNYCAHDGSNFNERTCNRVLVLASELLDLIDASSLNFTDLGGIDGIVKSGVFGSRETLREFLKLLDGYVLPDGDAENLRDKILAKWGLEDHHLVAAIDLDLVRYQQEKYVPDIDEFLQVGNLLDEIGWFTLTDLGRKFINEAS